MEPITPKEHDCTDYAKINCTCPDGICEYRNNLGFRFQKPTDKQLIDIAILFNGGKLQKYKLADMVAMAEFIIDRLHESGDVTKPSKKEQSVRTEIESL